jgi:hypothetical protein
MRKVKMRKFISLFLLCEILLLIGCVNENDKVFETTNFPSNALLHKQDVPPGFYSEGITFVKNIPQADSRIESHAFADQSPTHLTRIAHQLIVYENVSLAQTAFPTWEKQEFTDVWKEPSGFSFIPSDIDDIYRIGCIEETTMNIRYLICGYIQNHKNIISVVSASMDGANFTLEQFEKILAVLDKRLNEIK